MKKAHSTQKQGKQNKGRGVGRKRASEMPEAEENPVPDLPKWDLGDFYPAPDGPEIERDLETLRELAASFRDEYEGVVANLSGEQLGQATQEYEEICKIWHKILSYAELLVAQDRRRAPDTEPLFKKVSSLMDKAAFFEGEIIDMKEQALLQKLVAPEAAQYAPWFASVRQRVWQDLPPVVSSLSAEYEENNTRALVRAYREIVADIKVAVAGKQVGFEDACVLMGKDGLSKEEKESLRLAAGVALKGQSQKIATIFNAIAKDRMIDAGQARYPTPDHDVHMRNRLPPEAVATMFKALKASYRNLSHPFYTWKAGQHGLDEISAALRASALPTPGEERSFSWGEAQALVLRSFRRFSPVFNRVARKFFDRGFIDAASRPHKDAGAFMMPTSPDHFPYVLLNFQGTVDSVAAQLAHELGHGIHQILMEKAQGALMAEMPTVVEETASIFAEMLTFEEILRQEKDPKKRQIYLANQVENILSGIQQVAYYDFERRVFAAAKEKDLDAEEISDLWIAALQEYYGPHVEQDLCDRYHWMVVPHFYEMPFYVYSYAFAQVAVCALYQRYKEAAAAGEEERQEFVQNYIALLETGMTKGLHEMFAPFNLDPEEKEFWQTGVKLIEGYLHELLVPKPAAPATTPKQRPKP